MSNKRPPEGHVECRSMTCYCSFQIRGDQTLSPQGPKVKFSGERPSRSNSLLCVYTVNGLYYSFECRMPDEGVTGWRLKQCISLHRPPLPARWTIWHHEHYITLGARASTSQPVRSVRMSIQTVSRFGFFPSFVCLFLGNFPFYVLTFCANSLHLNIIKTESSKFSIISFHCFCILSFGVS